MPFGVGTSILGQSAPALRPTAPELGRRRAFEARVAIGAASATVARDAGERTKWTGPHDFTLGIVVVLVLCRKDARGCDALLDPALQGSADFVRGVAAAGGAKLSEAVWARAIAAMFHSRCHE